MEQLSFVLDRLSSTPAPVVLSSQNLLSLHELLISPDKEEDRRYVADAVYALFLMKAGQHALPVVVATSHPSPPAIKKTRLQKAIKPYTKARKVIKIFQERHQELCELFGGQQVSVTELRQWYEERYDLLPGDMDAFNNSRKFYRTFYYALENSPVFYKSPQSERGEWVVSAVGLDYAK
jgi:hypothetical protein